MPILHIFLTLVVVIIWGVNFLFVKIGLEEVSPLLLCAMRFTLASIPAIFFIPFPSGPIRLTVMYGLVMFALQFSLFFMGMHAGMTPGMASLIMQVQVFFSMIFAVVFLQEKPQVGQVLGALVSFMGIAVVAGHCDQEMSLIGFLCMLGSAATWGIGNLITKKTKNINMLALVVWGSFIAAMPLLLCSVMIEGLANIGNTFHQITWRGIGALLYIVYFSTWIGYGLWNWLLSRYPVSTIVPFTLLVPVVGILASVVFYHETFQLWKMYATVLVVGGLIINILSSKMYEKLAFSLLNKLNQPPPKPK